MIFHLVLYHVRQTALLLFRDVSFQFRRGECLLLSGREYKVDGLHLDEGVNLVAAGNLFAHSLQRTDFVVAGLPVVTFLSNGIVLNDGSIHLTHHFFVLKFVQRKAIARFADIVVLRHVCHHAFIHHQLDIRCRCVLLVVLVERLEIVTHDGASRDDIGAQKEIQCGDECCRDDIRTQQPLETHAACQHSDNLRISSQFGCEEDDGNKYEQR